MAEAVYTTREAIMAAPDVKASAHAGPAIDRAIVSASAQVDTLCHRGNRASGIPGFAPWVGTLTFDWPNHSDAQSGRLWLDQYTLISLTGMSSGGITINTNNVLMEPAASGPPYTRIDLRRSSATSFSAGSSGGQQSLSLTGTWCGAPMVDSVAGSLSGGISSGATSLTLTAGGAFIGIGSTVRIGSERMFVTNKGWLSSAQTGSLTASNADQLLAVSNGAAFMPGEELLIDAERVLIRDVAGNNLIVQRSWSGSTLASHTGATIYWPRLLTVERGVLGTTAAAHANAEVIQVFRPPAMVETLTMAYALDIFFQEASGYARIMGEGESARPWLGRAIRETEERVYGAYGRRVRFRAV